MKNQVEYRVIEGDKKTFEGELNKCIKEDWNPTGILNTTHTDEGFWYSTLVIRPLEA